MVFGGENAESYYDEGLTASMKGDFALAIRHFEQALRLDSALTTALHQLGRCYLRLGDAAKAAEYLKKVVTSKPKQVPPRIDLGYALLDLGRPDQARAVFSEVTQHKPDNARAHLGLAYCAFQDGQWDAAAQLAEDSANQGGANFATFFLLGRAGRLAGRPNYNEALNRADKLIEKSIETSPDQPEGYYLRGELFFIREDFSKALENFRQAEDRGDKEKHYAAFNEHFTMADIIAKRGLCHQRLGNADGAQKAGAETLELDPGHELGQMLSGQGEETP